MGNVLVRNSSNIVTYIHIGRVHLNLFFPQTYRPNVLMVVNLYFHIGSFKVIISKLTTFCI